MGSRARPQREATVPQEAVSSSEFSDGDELRDGGLELVENSEHKQGRGGESRLRIQASDAQAP